MSLLARIVRGALARPWLVVGAFLWLAPISDLALRDLPIEYTPNLVPAQFSIDTQAPGLVAEQVEQTVTRPIEAAVLGAPGVAHVGSRSLQGLSVVTGEFAAGVDHNRVRQALDERLAGVRDLPAGVARPVMGPLSAPDGDLIKIAFSAERLSPMDLRDIVQWTVRPRLLAVRGVAQVRLFGGQVRRLEVRARPGDLSDSDLGFLDIVAAVRRATGVAGAGFIDTPNQRVLIAPQGQALTPDAVGAGQIQTPGGAPVRIGDVADVVEAPAPTLGDAQVMGRPVVLLAMERQAGANTVETSRAVEQALAQLQPMLAAQGVTLRTDLDRPADFTIRTLRGLAGELLVGLALVAVLLTLLMREARSVIIALITLPVTFAVALTVLKLLGLTLNIMTLGGLVVALGLVIDDAVIDVEAISARLREGRDRRRGVDEAVLDASAQIRAPLILGGVALSLALAPLLWVKGPAGALLAPLAAAIIVASLTSLVVALTLTPALAALLLGRRAARPAPRVVHRFMERAMRGLPALAARPGIVAGATLILIGAGVAVALTFHAEFLPSVWDSHLFIETRVSPGISPTAAADLDGRIAADLQAMPSVRSVTESLGRGAFGGDTAGLEEARFDLALAPDLSGAEQARLAERIRRRLSTLPGVEAHVRSRFDASQVFGVGGAPLQVLLFGHDLDALDRTAAQVGVALKGVASAQDVSAPASATLPTVRADLDFNRLAIFGLSTADVLDTVQAAFAGQTMAEIYQGDRSEDLTIIAQTALRRDPEGVGNLLLRSSSGISVPLKSVAQVYLAESRAEIRHQSGQRVRIVEANAKDGRVDRLDHEARAALARLSGLPGGVYLETRAFNSAGALWRPLLKAYGVSIFLLFGFLTLAFDARTALVAFVASAFGWLGAIGVIAALGGVVSLGATAALVAVFAFSLRGAVLLLSRIEARARTAGTAWSFATVAHATRERAGTMVLSVLLLIAALAPLALGAGRGGHEILGAMAIVIIGGAVAGLVANLTLLPLLAWRVWRPDRSDRVDPVQSA